MITLQLRDDLLLAQGAARLVYRHPERDDCLVKVFRQEYIARKFGTQAPWYKKIRRLGYLIAYQREWNEQYAAFLHYGYHPPYMQSIIGTMPTNFGLGQVVEAVRGRDGTNAPTLYQLIKSNRFDETAKTALDHFFDWLMKAPIVISELNRHNLLYRFDPELGEHFCIVDGIGDTTFVPIKSWSPRLNARNKRYWIAKLRRTLSSAAPVAVIMNKK